VSLMLSTGFSLSVSQGGTEHFAARFKTHITETAKGLGFIIMLRPVVYNFQTKKYDEFLRKDMPKNNAMLAASHDFLKLKV
jgi:hypothetical protein